jgi:hypothetical protein
MGCAAMMSDWLKLRLEDLLYLRTGVSELMTPSFSVLSRWWLSHYCMFSRVLTSSSSRLVTLAADDEVGYVAFRVVSCGVCASWAAAERGSLVAAAEGRSLIRWRTHSQGRPLPTSVR